MIKKMGVLIAMLALIACASEKKPEAEPLPPLGAFSAAGTVDPNFRPQQGALLAWQEDIYVADSASAQKVDKAARRWVQNKIQAEIEKKGYAFVSRPELADYIVAAAVLMDKSEESQRIQEIAQVFPHLGGDEPRYNEGEIIVALKRPSSASFSSALWRSSIQAYTVGKKIDASVQEQRLTFFIERLVSDLPRAGSK